MTRTSPNPVARLLSRALPVFFLALPASGFAQEPPPVPPDSIRADTATIDSIPRDSVTLQADSLRPAVPFPDMFIGPAADPARGIWVWDREALLREAALTVLDLLERIPAVATFRAGAYGQPEAASGWGGTAGRVEVLLDGFILDPLVGSTYDLSLVPLAHLRELRVERRLGVLRIHLLTENPLDARPYTRIEAGVGEPDADMFRALFTVPYAIVGPLSLAIERVDTDGTLGREPATVFTGWGKWSWNSADRGVQFEARRTTVRREPQSPWPVERVRQDLIMRARNHFTSALTGEIYAGLMHMEEEPALTQADSAVERLERDVVQAGARLALQVPAGLVTGIVRYRNEAPLPSLETAVDGDFRVGPLSAGAEVSRATWDGGDATLFTSARAALGPLGGFSVFGEWMSGERGAAVWPDSMVVEDRSGWRAGLALSLGTRASGSVSYVSVDRTRALPFGLPWDSASPPTTASEATAVEAQGRLILVRRWGLAIESAITDWQDLRGWVYTPVRSWRTALEVHTLPLPSGNLEILARAEAAQRSVTLAYAASPEEGESLFVELPSYTTFNAYLQIRVIDVRAFIGLEDARGQDIAQLPDRFRRGPRIFYGVKWNLWN